MRNSDVPAEITRFLDRIEETLDAAGVRVATV